MSVAERPLAENFLDEPPLQLVGLTYESYLAGPLIEGKYDIIEGKVIFDVSGAAYGHQEAAGNIYLALCAFQKVTKSGRTFYAPCDVLVSRFPLRMRQPDVLFISRERIEAMGGIPDEGPLTVAPEIIVEVLSPTETPRSIRAKLEDYQQIGVREAWLVNRENETVQLLRLGSGAGGEIETVAEYAHGQTLESLAVPGLTVALADIFESM